MNEKEQPYTLTLKPAQGLWLYLIPILAFHGIVIYYMPTFTPFSFSLQNTSDIILSGIYIACILLFNNALAKALWLITGKVTVTLDNDTMTVSKKYLGMPFVNEYNLQELHDIEVKHVEDTRTIIGLPRFYFEIAARYYDPSIIFFKYGQSNRKLNIGNYCQDFPARDFRDELFKRMSKH